MARQFDVVIQKDSEGYFVASVPVLPGCHTQAKSLDVLMERIREAIELCLEVQGEPTSETCGYSAHHGCGVTSFSSLSGKDPVAGAGAGGL